MQWWPAAAAAKVRTIVRFYEEINAIKPHIALDKPTAPHDQHRRLCVHDMVKEKFIAHQGCLMSIEI